MARSAIKLELDEEEPAPLAIRGVYMDGDLFMMVLLDTVVLAQGDI